MPPRPRGRRNRADGDDEKITFSTIHRQLDATQAWAATDFITESTIPHQNLSPTNTWVDDVATSTSTSPLAASGANDDDDNNGTLSRPHRLLKATSANDNDGNGSDSKFSFHDFLHRYTMVARPRVANDLGMLFQLLAKLLTACETDEAAWQTVALTACLRRYHSKAPEAKDPTATTTTATSSTTTSGRGSDESVGDGERLIYYATVLMLHEYATNLSTILNDKNNNNNNNREDGPDPTNTTSVATQMATLAHKAATSLVNCTVRVGGTRDLSTLIELMTFRRLQDQATAVMNNGRTDSEGHPKVFRDVLVPCLKSMLSASTNSITNGDGDYGSSGELLDLAIRLAAGLLDDDFSKLKEATEKDSVVLSTMHVTIPHNGRGSNTKAAWQRKLANTVAEILIWDKTSATKHDERFRDAMFEFVALDDNMSTSTIATALTDHSHAHDLIQRMQTTVRKKRQFLNGHSRTKGFMLTSLYQMDKSSITLREIKVAKAGDLYELKRVATKHGDARILKLIAMRSLDPTKSTAFQSLEEIVNGWIDTAKTVPDEDEITPIQLTIQANSLRATLDILKKAAKKGKSGGGGEGSTTTDCDDRPSWVVCLDSRRKMDCVCAVLVAAALETPRLVLNGTQVDIAVPSSSVPSSSFSSENGEKNESETDRKSCSDVINDIIHSREYIPSTVSSTSVDMSTFLREKVQDSTDVVVVSTRDLELDEKVLQGLQDRDITVRVHATERIVSEGKVSLSFASDINNRIKAGQPLSLGVILDCTGSMGDEIEGCKRGALDMIMKFQELAPVSKVNVMGYWDPVNVRSDPQPQSSGYLEANEKNFEVLKDFMHTSLKCQGGGDEPEDIPQALEKYIGDFKAAGLSVDEGVHLVFFIADAGYRRNEQARVEAAVAKMKRMGIIMIICAARRWSSSLDLMRSTCEKAFVGQYGQVNGVGQLSAIAATTTETIRASLFESSDIVSVTASVGSTIDSVRKLVTFQADHDAMKKTEVLAKLPDEMEETEDEEEEVKNIDVDEGDEAVKETGVEMTGASKSSSSTKVFAEKKEIQLTSRDRLYLQLSRLPKLFHDEVFRVFGGKSLQTIAAESIAERLVKDEIPIVALKEAGYPSDFVSLVQSTIAGYGMARVNA